jgi:hypothetical protein
MVPELLINPLSVVELRKMEGIWGPFSLSVPSFVIFPVMKRPTAEMQGILVEAGLSKPADPTLTHAAEAGFPLPPIMSAARELDDNSERTRDQGIINGVTFPAVSRRNHGMR